MRRRRKRIVIGGREVDADEPEDAPIEAAPIAVPASAKPSPGKVEMAPIAVAPVGPAAARPAEPAPTPRARPGAAERWGKLSRSFIEGYRLEALLGEGTMGAVFRAEQLSLHRPVAVKVLSPHYAGNERYLRRFLREARAVARLNHPNVVSGIDVGESQGYRYFVMEFVEGPTLLDMLQSGEPLDPLAATRIVLQVAKALDHAHKAGLVHRDVKPANVIITKKGGLVKLCDLGLAKDVEEDGGETSEGRALGTPLYISPEQARGDADIDIRSDLYSLGATYYYALTGRPPFDGPTHAVIMAKHLTEEFTPVRDLRPDVPAGCAEVCEQLLEKEREDRHQTPEALIAELEAVLEGRWKEEPVIRARRRSRRRRFR